MPSAHLIDALTALRIESRMAVRSRSAAAGRRSVIFWRRERASSSDTRAVESDANSSWSSGVVEVRAAARVRRAIIALISEISFWSCSGEIAVVAALFRIVGGETGGDPLG
jgi:hypothetical protein